MKKYVGLYMIIFIILVTLVATIIIINGNPIGVKVDLTNAEITKGRRTDDIKRYTQNDFDEFLKDYNNSNLDDVYITEFLFDGVSMYKPYDLDDFIDDGNEHKTKALKITVYNINTTGDIKLNGNLTGMLAINTNNIKHDINLILDGVNIDTDSKKVPAIYVYNKDVMYTSHKVTIKTTKDSQNVIEGGKLKKVSLISSDELSNYSSFYSDDTKENYLEYTNYYGIYNTSELNKILFAKVMASNEDLKDGDPYYFYKASGAISSDIDLYFEGEGYLKVTSKNKEGIESKGNLTFSGGTGDYEIYAQDDCLNTTTANSNNGIVRNDLTIDVNSLLAYVALDDEEGDAIDYNGKLTINGGTIYAFAHPSSPDAGLDSVSGTYINGGTVIATGNMADAIASESKNKYIYASFDKISADTLIVIKDQDDKIITAFKTGRDIQNLLYSDSNLNYESYKIYTGGTIDGEETNGLYKTINSYTGGTEITFRETTNMNRGMKRNQITSNNDTGGLLLKVLIGEILLLIVFVVIYIVSIKKTN